MTNLQQSAPRISPQSLRRLWLGLPIAAGAVISLALVLFVLVPLWAGMRRDAARLRELQAMRDEVSLLRRQLATMDTRERQALNQQAKLFDLVAGSGDISTFLSALDRVARRVGVQVQLYEPVAAPPPPPAASRSQRGGNQPGEPPERARSNRSRGRQGTEETKPTDPLEVEGLRRRSVLVSARGTFPALLNFMRSLEELNVLVVQSNLQLDLAQRPNQRETATGPTPVLLKLQMSLYGKPDPSELKTAAPEAGESPARRGASDDPA
jgi:type IV pilus assembly protein PilO